MGLRCQIYRWIYSIDMPAKSFLFLEINLRFYLTPLGIVWKNTCLRKYPCLLVFRLYCSIQIFGKSLSARLFFKWFVLFDNSVFVLFFFFSSCSWQHSLWEQKEKTREGLSIVVMSCWIIKSHNSLNRTIQFNRESASWVDH